MKNTLYFLTSEGTSGFSHVIDKMNRLGQAIQYGGGFFLWSDLPILQVHQEATQSVNQPVYVIPVDVQKITSSSLLTPQVVNFITQYARAA